MSQDPAAAPALVRRIDRLLSDALLGFFALASLFLGILPEVFALNPRGNLLLDVAEFAIVLLFAVEYAAGLACAQSRRNFVADPWRILDLLIIVTGMLSLFPGVNNLLRNTPALRLIRLVRLALYGTRTGVALTSRASADDRTAALEDAPRESYALMVEPGLRLEAISWEDALERLSSPHDDWLLMSNPTELQLQPIADALKVPALTLRTRLHDSPFPRIDRMESYTTIFSWYPSVEPSDPAEIPVVVRTPVLLVASMHNVVLLTRDHGELLADLSRRLAESDPAEPPLFGATFTLLKAILRRYARVVDQLETALIRVEAEQAQLKDRAFLERTFKLRNEITRVRGSIKHLNQVIARLADQPVAIKGFETTPRPPFMELAEDAENLYESVDDLMATLGALVDLRLNVTSFQMNKTMRLLAVLTALTIIPAVTGGMLGMNLAGNPWPPNLQQVSFGVAAAMAVFLYIFAVKGWLR